MKTGPLHPRRGGGDARGEQPQEAGAPAGAGAGGLRAVWAAVVRQRERGHRGGGGRRRGGGRDGPGQGVRLPPEHEDLEPHAREGAWSGGRGRGCCGRWLLGICLLCLHTHPTTNSTNTPKKHTNTNTPTHRWRPSGRSWRRRRRSWRSCGGSRPRTSGCATWTTWWVLIVGVCCCCSGVVVGLADILYVWEWRGRLTN